MDRITIGALIGAGTGLLGNMEKKKQVEAAREIEMAKARWGALANGAYGTPEYIAMPSLMADMAGGALSGASFASSNFGSKGASPDVSKTMGEASQSLRDFEKWGADKGFTDGQGINEAMAQAQNQKAMTGALPMTPIPQSTLPASVPDMKMSLATHPKQNYGLGLDFDSQDQFQGVMGQGPETMQMGGKTIYGTKRHQGTGWGSLIGSGGI